MGDAYQVVVGRRRRCRDRGACRPAPGRGRGVGRSNLGSSRGQRGEDSDGRRHKTSLGKILVAGASGRTLYLLTSDGKNKSTCTGGCAQVWPALLVSGKPTAGKGASKSKLGEIRRGKSHQVTYASHPLYEFAQDSGPGQTNGEGTAGFYVVSPSGKAIK